MHHFHTHKKNKFLGEGQLFPKVIPTGEGNPLSRLYSLPLQPSGLDRPIHILKRGEISEGKRPGGISHILLYTVKCIGSYGRNEIRIVDLKCRLLVVCNVAERLHRSAANTRSSRACFVCPRRCNWRLGKMRSKVDGVGSTVDDLQTTQPASDFDQLLNDDAALLDFTVSTNMLFATTRLA